MSSTKVWKIPTFWVVSTASKLIYNGVCISKVMSLLPNAVSLQAFKITAFTSFLSTQRSTTGQYSSQCKFLFVFVCFFLPTKWMITFVFVSDHQYVVQGMAFSWIIIQILWLCFGDYCKQRMKAINTYDNHLLDHCPLSPLRADTSLNTCFVLQLDLHCGRHLRCNGRRRVCYCTSAVWFTSGIPPEPTWLRLWSL